MEVHAVLVARLDRGWFERVRYVVKCGTEARKISRPRDYDVLLLYHEPLAHSGSQERYRRPLSPGGGGGQLRSNGPGGPREKGS